MAGLIPPASFAAIENRVWSATIPLMSGFNLFDHQKRLLAHMVQAIEKGCRPEFTIYTASTFTGIVFEGKDGLHEQIECDPGDLLALDNEGLINLVSRESGILYQRAIDAVRSNFSDSSGPTGGPVFHIQGNVANIQSGNGNTANVQQNINPNFAEMLAIIQECRNLIGSTDAAGERAREALDDLEAEIKSGSPKKSRAISFLESASRYATAGSALAVALSKLAAALHKLHF